MCWYSCLVSKNNWNFLWIYKYFNICNRISIICYFFNNNYLFYFISFFSILVCFSLITKNYYNILLLIIIILNNPQYTIYHKYFDPFLIIAFFTIFIFKVNLNEIFYAKKYYFIFCYFLFFLIISNIKSILIT